MYMYTLKIFETLDTMKNWNDQPNKSQKPHLGSIYQFS